MHVMHDTLSHVTLQPCIAIKTCTKSVEFLIDMRMQVILINKYIMKIPCIEYLKTCLELLWYMVVGYTQS